MNPFEFALGVIIVLTIGRILKARYGVTKDRAQDYGGSEYRVDRVENGLSAENARLREEMRSLKERVQVLERVITDNNRSLELDREIERLRDKTSV